MQVVWGSRLDVKLSQIRKMQDTKVLTDWLPVLPSG